MNGLVDVSALQNRVRRFATEVMDAALEAMPEQMRPYAPQGETGRLRESIQRDRGDFSTSESTVRGRIIAPVIQAKTTDQGAPAHLIRPKKVGGLLVFQASTGETVFTRFVNHPGNAAKPWWDRALRASFESQLRFAAITHSTR